MKTILKFLMASILFLGVTPYTEAVPFVAKLIISLGAAALLVFSKPAQRTINGKQLFRADVAVELWVRYIMERFWSDNKFLQHAFNDDQYVLNGKIVHIPQPGALPTVVKNRSSYPATAVLRTDTDVTYNLDAYTTDPTHIPAVEQAEISYDKMNSVLGDHMDTITDTVARDMLIKWSPAAAMFIRTSGNAVAPITGQTGNRKGFDQSDLKRAMIKMNTTTLGNQDERFCMIDDNMYEYFYDSLGIVAARDFSAYVDAKNGVVGRLHGFNIMTRSSVLAYNSSDVVKALGSSLAAADNLSCICWRKNSVARAIGDKTLFQDKNNPLYYGDIHSVLMRAGGRKRRSDGAGVIAIVQDAAA